MAALVGGIVLGFALIVSSSSDPSLGDDETDAVPLMLGIVTMVQGIAAWAVLHVLAALAENVGRMTDNGAAALRTLRREGGSQSPPPAGASLPPNAPSGEGPRAAQPVAPIPDTAPPEEGTVYEGDDVDDVTEHALGVKWGRTTDGRVVVYQPPRSTHWFLYEPGKTPYVPPRAFRD